MTMKRSTYIHIALRVGTMVLFVLGWFHFKSNTLVEVGLSIFI